MLLYAPLRQGPTAFHVLRLVPELPAPMEFLTRRDGILSVVVHVALKDLHLKHHHLLLELAQHAG